jgi:glycerophosphoryl diester phosphodiesterase
MPTSRFPVLDRPLPHAIAHRGGAWEEPENSERAFRHAVGLGYTFLETDIRATADGVAVVFHDASLDRSTDVRGVIRELPYREVAAARIHGRQPILTLARLLEEFGDTRFNLDIKEINAIVPFVDTVRAMSAWDRIVVGSFSSDRLRRVRRLAGPRLATSMAPREVAELWLQARRPRGSWRPPPVACVQIPPSFGKRVLVEPGLLALAHAHGWQVHVWTIDDPEQMVRLLDLGVDGIMTDRPRVLRDVLRDRGQWP